LGIGNYHTQGTYVLEPVTTKSILGFTPRTVGALKKGAIAEKIFKTLAIFNDS
jgi:hypothetical protein